MAAPIIGLEPQLPPTGLPRISDGDDLLRVSYGLALGPGALRLGRSRGGSTLALLRSAVWTHPPTLWRRRVTGKPQARRQSN